MLHRIRAHVTYANVVASLALFVAVGGTSYAAITLPRNSVGDRQIKPRAVGADELRSRAVTSRAIRNGTIRTFDMAESTREALVKPGPPGPTGAPGVALRASFNARGDQLAGNATAHGPAGHGARTVTFPRSVAGCVPVATLARNPGGEVFDPSTGRIVVAIEGDNVRVETYAADGSPSPMGFNLLVAC